MERLCAESGLLAERVEVVGPVRRFDRGLRDSCTDRGDSRSDRGDSAGSDRHALLELLAEGFGFVRGLVQLLAGVLGLFAEIVHLPRQTVCRGLGLGILLFQLQRRGAVLLALLRRTGDRVGEQLHFRLLRVDLLRENAGLLGQLLLRRVILIEGTRRGLHLGAERLDLLVDVGELAFKFPLAVDSYFRPDVGCHSVTSNQV